MKFKAGQKYRIVDIDAWWSNTGFSELGSAIGSKFKNGDAVIVDYDYFNRLSFFLVNSSISSQDISALVTHEKWYNKCVELIDSAEQFDNTVSLCHVADVLEDALCEENTDKSVDMIQACINSLRKAGY